MRRWLLYAVVVALIVCAMLAYQNNLFSMNATAALRVTTICDGGAVAEIVYVDQGERAEVQVMGEQYVLHRAMSGSGARYMNDKGIELWEHQGVLTITLAEPYKSLTCSVS